jgi:cold-inducible RNA-binding protein
MIQRIDCYKLDISARVSGKWISVSEASSQLPALFNMSALTNLLYFWPHSTVRQLRSRFSGRRPRPASPPHRARTSTAQCRGPRLKNIFVGNLSFNTSEDELRQMFEPFGQVDRVSIMTDRDTGRSRGFGFVEMASNEDGEKAITALNGSQVGGRTLNVNEARPKTEHAGGGGRDRGGRGGDRGGDRGGRGGGGGGRGRY